MNQTFRSSDLALTTQAAEGLTRRRWTVAEIEAMTRAGILDEDERFELIGGEIVPMSSKGIQHETLKNRLGSGLIDQSQKMTAAAMQMAEKNVWAHRS